MAHYTTRRAFLTSLGMTAGLAALTASRDSGRRGPSAGSS